MAVWLTLVHHHVPYLSDLFADEVDVETIMYSTGCDFNVLLDISMVHFDSIMHSFTIESLTTRGHRKSKTLGTPAYFLSSSSSSQNTASTSA